MVLDGEQATVWLREFDACLTPQAKRRMERDPEMSQLVVRCIEGGWRAQCEPSAPQSVRARAATQAEAHRPRS